MTGKSSARKSPASRRTEAAANRAYWNHLADAYQEATRISSADFHLGPLLPSATALGLLPPLTAGMRCLELGCGAGQNSLFLAARGAACTATDVSDGQLRHGRRLARNAGLSIDFRRLPMEELGQWEAAPFDFVHSTYALPFVTDPARVIAAIAAKIVPGGTCLLTTGHPLFAGEYLEIEEEGEGMFLRHYFQPPPDVREDPADDDLIVRAKTYPLGQTIDWLHQAGLQLLRLVEPQPLPIPTMTAAEIAAQVPYISDAWRDLYPQLARIPVVAVFLARKVAGG